MKNEREGSAQAALAGFGRVIGRTRFVVLLAVAAVMLVAVSLFLLGVLQAVSATWNAWRAALGGGIDSTDLTVKFLEIVLTMLKAVVFYIIGVGLYSLFIAPLNLTVALGVESMNDLESKVVSVVIVMMAVTFLEHFILWENPVEMLQRGTGLALVIAALVFFQHHSHRAKEVQKSHDPDLQVRAKREMFQENKEEREIRSDEEHGSAARAHDE
jgi:uncharacterized membrane protein YqhA